MIFDRSWTFSIIALSYNSYPLINSLCNTKPIKNIQTIIFFLIQTLKSTKNLRISSLY